MCRGAANPVGNKSVAFVDDCIGEKGRGSGSKPCRTGRCCYWRIFVSTRRKRIMMRPLRAVWRTWRRCMSNDAFGTRSSGACIHGRGDPVFATQRDGVSDRKGNCLSWRRPATAQTSLLWPFSGGAKISGKIDVIDALLPQGRPIDYRWGHGLHVFEGQGA